MSKAQTAAIVFLVGFLSLFAGAYNHEATHAEIARQNGCTAQIHLYPTSERFMYTSYQCPGHVEEKVMRIQNNVEAAGYQIVPLYGFAGLIVGLQLALLNLKRREIKHYR